MSTNNTNNNQSDNGFHIGDAIAAMYKFCSNLFKSKKGDADLARTQNKEFTISELHVIFSQFSAENNKDKFSKLQEANSQLKEENHINRATILQLQKENQSKQTAIVKLEKNNSKLKEGNKYNKAAILKLKEANSKLSTENKYNKAAISSLESDCQIEQGKQTKGSRTYQIKSRKF